VYDACGELEALDPDEFIVQQFHLSPSTVVESARKVRHRLKSPPVSAAQYLITLEMQGLLKTAALLRDFRNLM